jgi:hypothetical protein
MRKDKVWLFYSATIVFIITSGCALPPALVVGGVAAGGTGTGTYYYVNGETQTDYSFAFDKVWNACEKTMADMRAFNVKPYKEISFGNIAAVINDENVKFTVKYKAKNVTTVSVRVGLFGNKSASQFLQDKIGDNIKN